MRRSIIITGLDIGSSKVSAVAAEIGRSGNFSVLSQVTQPSGGISRGTISNLNEAVNSVAGVLDRLREKISRGLGDIYVNVSGQTVKGARSKGMIALSLRGREVTRLDMTRCAGVAGTIHLPFDREIVHRIILNFSVDDQPWVKNPLGLYASRLNCEAYIITADVNNIQNIYKCVNNAGYEIKDIVFTGMADGAALLNKDETQKGALLLDIGHSVTHSSIFFDEKLNDLDAIPVGAGDMKGNFKDSPEFENLVSRVNSRMQGFLKSGGSVESVILTGGMSFTDYLAEFLEERLSRPVKMGVAKEIKGDISSAESVKLATAIGLVKYARQKREEKILESKNLVKNLSSRVVDIFNNYF